MNFISYAQNLEDVILWRALKHVEAGFYIDVGANDPIVHSVTKAFYDRGWHGINIEPLASHYADLREARERDINLQCAAGADVGEIEIWECDVRGWATASLDVISQHRANGHDGVFHKVPVFPLKDICAQYVKGEIHFLKIDVEGLEKSVIDGMDFTRFRPWVLVIEATWPNSTEEIYGEWEGTVLSAGYQLAYSDGLNRFYVPKEHPELLHALRYPPNVFDEFILSAQLNADLRAEQAETWAQQAETRAQQSEARAQQAEIRAQQAGLKAQQAEIRAQQAGLKAQQAETRAQHAGLKAQQAETRAQQAGLKAQHADASARMWEIQANQWYERLLAVHASTSWKITKPLRGIRRLLSGDLSVPERATAAVKRSIKRVLRPGVSAGMSRAPERPESSGTLGQWRKYTLGLSRRLVRAEGSSETLPESSHAGTDASSITMGLDRITPGQVHRVPGSAPDINEILDRIKAAIEKDPRK